MFSAVKFWKCFDFGAVGHIKTDRAEERFNALQGAGDGVQATACFAAAGQGDVERFFGEARFEAPIA